MILLTWFSARRQQLEWSSRELPDEAQEYCLILA